MKNDQRINLFCDPIVGGSSYRGCSYSSLTMRIMVMKKYKLLEDDYIEVHGIKLFRIEAVKDFNFISKGDKGGYLEKEENLSHYENAWVFGNARVSGDAIVSGYAEVSGNAEVLGNARVSGDAIVSGNAKVSEDVITRGNDVFNITSNSQWNITITPNYIKIGCQFHSKERWFSFSDKAISKMDVGALNFWKKWKPILMVIC